MRPARSQRFVARRSLAAGALLLLAAGCWSNTQRHPGPMRETTQPLPSGGAALFPPGPEEVLVVRHSDPVLVRSAGQAQSYVLRSFNKQVRVNAGARIFTDAGGRAELIYSGGSDVFLNGLASAAIGSKSRSEPILVFGECDRARVFLAGGDRIQLLGGAELSGDGGPYFLEHPRPEIARVRNSSRGPCRVAYLEAIFDLDPGQVIDLPLLPEGTWPREVDPDFQLMLADGVPIEVRGDIEVLPQERGTRLRARGDDEVRGYGLRVLLAPGEEVVFGGLDLPGPAEEAPDSGNPGGN